MEFRYISLSDYQHSASQAGGSVACAFFVSEDLSLGEQAALEDSRCDGLLSQALLQPRFNGKAGDVTSTLTPKGIDIARMILVGLGEADSITPRSYEEAAAKASGEANTHGIDTLIIVMDNVKVKELGSGEGEAHALFGARLGSYTFDKYFTTKTDEERPSLNEMIVAGHKEGAAAYHPRWEALADGITLTRNVVSEPANIMHPESLAELCTQLGKLGVDVEVIGEKRLQKLGMEALVGVGRGSSKESQLVVMRWNGRAEKKDAPVAFVGKGVCFDSGGISIKPAGGMEDMKWDMGGAGTVIGLMRTLAQRKAKVNAVGVVGLVENMPDGNAQRPGDVVTSYSGQTIEVINTDAEGRLVLADALWYTQEQFKPRAMIDLATLTGAILVGLGSQYAGLFASDDELAERLLNAGEETHDRTWRLPMGKEYDSGLESDIADMRNISKDREAGSIIAAQFLQRFTNNVPWAHLDIAGMAWAKKTTALTPKGASGYGVRLLDRLVEQYYEG